MLPKSLKSFVLNVLVVSGEIGLQPTHIIPHIQHSVSKTLHHV